MHPQTADFRRHGYHNQASYEVEKNESVPPRRNLALPLAFGICDLPDDTKQTNQGTNIGGLPERKIAELRRSLFVPVIPQNVSDEELMILFREFGNIQEVFIKEKERGRGRFCIVIFVEEETAFDVLHTGLITHDNRRVEVEERRVNGRVYPPRVPMDTPITVSPSNRFGGRGVPIPLSVVADAFPIVSGNNYAHAVDSSYRGPVAMRAPNLTQFPALRSPYLPAVSPVTGVILNPPINAIAPANLPLNQPSGIITNGIPGSHVKRKSVYDSMPFLRESPQVDIQMQLLMKYSQLTSDELVFRQEIRQKLEKSFRRIFRKCCVRLYGSSVNTFGVRGSDIDAYLELFIDSPEALASSIPPREKDISYYWSNVTQLGTQPYEPGELRHFAPQDILRLMEKLMRYLSHSFGLREVLSIPSARTPILKLYQSISDTSIDISFSSRLVFQNTGLLYMYSAQDARIRPLIFTIRRWAELKDLTGENGLTKYALTMLVIFFLYRISPPVLMPPDEIKQWVRVHPTPELDKFVRNKEQLDFDMSERNLLVLAKSLPPSQNEKTPGALLLEFLNFYANFDFTKNVMCCSNGEIIPRETFENPPGEPFKFRYINLQDPFDLSHNIAKTVSLQTFGMISQTLWSEVILFSRTRLDLALLFDKDRKEREMGSSSPAPPVMVSISGYRSSVPTTSWISQVPDLARRILEEFLRCDYIDDLKEETVQHLRRIPHVGSRLRDMHFKLFCRSWQNRRNMRKQLRKTRRLNGSLQDEWDLETDIGKKLEEWQGASQRPQLDFYITVILNNVEAERVCLFLSALDNSADVTDFFEFLWRFLPEQLRRFLKLDQFVTDTTDDPTQRHSGTLTKDEVLRNE